MGKYRKRPVIIEARQITDETAVDVAVWCGGEWYQRYNFGVPQTKVVAIPTLEGTMEGTEGDWIIKGVKGEFYPCRKDIFEETYEEVEGP